jgi:hypothetical protein
MTLGAIPVTGDWDVTSDGTSDVITEGCDVRLLDG